MLRTAARRVGEGDLTVRVSPRGKDELDELGRAFDRMVAELGETRSRLEYLQKVSAWQEVARRLAHEIKNPLTPIQLAVQELGSKYRGEDASYARLLATAQEILKEEIDSMRRLVDDFSAFAKLPKVEPAPIDLGQVVEDFVRGHNAWQPHVRYDKPAAPVEALCDRMLIRRVLANLVENAVQAAEGAGRVPEVVLHVEADRGGDDDRGRIDIVVDDNGPGVPASARERIFDPYVTTKENGTGLGLAIVRKIVIDHGGDVDGRRRAVAARRGAVHGRDPCRLASSCGCELARPQYSAGPRDVSVMRSASTAAADVASRASMRPPRTQQRSTPSASMVSVVGSSGSSAPSDSCSETAPSGARRSARTTSGVSSTSIYANRRSSRRRT